GISICDDKAHFRAKVSRDLKEWNDRYDLKLPVDHWPIDVIDGYMGPGYAQPYSEALETMVMLARAEGLVLDPVYTGKAFHGLLREIGKGTFEKARNVIFIHTGGIFGTLAARRDILNHLSAVSKG